MQHIYRRPSVCVSVCVCVCASVTAAAVGNWKTRAGHKRQQEYNPKVPFSFSYPSRFVSTPHARHTWWYDTIRRSCERQQWISSLILYFISFCSHNIHIQVAWNNQNSDAISQLIIAGHFWYPGVVVVGIEREKSCHSHNFGSPAGGESRSNG